MKFILPGCGMIAVVLAVFAADKVRADGDYWEGCDKTFVDEAYGSTSFRESCGHELRRRRAELAAWGINVSNMSKLDAWDRHDAERVVREDARREQQRRDQLESERLATERAQAQAEQEKVAAASARESERYAAEQMKAGQQLMQQQDQMLKDLDVSLGSSTAVHANCGDDYDAGELRMYQVMVDTGAAAHCKNLTCGALVDCVDEVLDAEED